MLSVYLALCACASAAAAPSYDQRQDGEFNVRADVQNVVFLVALPQKMGLPAIPPGLLDGFFKDAKPEHDIQERADVQVMEAFVEPSTPYKVEIGSSGRYADGDGRAVEVVIAGRRRPGPDVVAEEEPKLLGATEQCGPDRERDPVTLTCRDQPDAPDASEPAAVLAASEPAAPPAVAEPAALPAVAEPAAPPAASEPAIQPEVVPVLS